MKRIGLKLAQAAKNAQLAQTFFDVSLKAGAG